jgi:hypothetical protein
MKVILDIQGIVVEVDDNDARKAMDKFGQDDLEGGACAFARECVHKVVNGFDLEWDGIEIREVTTS